MALTKITKTPAYFSRFQVKLRRRREGKTDYQARRALVRQECNKYNSPKYRFVVRMSNRRVTCAITYSTIAGDHVVAQASSHELSKYGMPVGHCNYAAAYATGLLCARRCLQKFDLDEACVGKLKADGEDYHIEDDMEEESGVSRRPFKCNLDIGLRCPTTGARVFGAMKGAVDGGLNIPHSNKRFPGFVKGVDGAEDKYDPEVHRKKIFGHSISNAMRTTEKNDPEVFAKRYALYIQNGITADNLESKLQACHEAIRANPAAEKKGPWFVEKPTREGNYIKFVTRDGKTQTKWKPLKLTAEQRRERVQAKLAEIARVAQAALEQ